MFYEDVSFGRVGEKEVAKQLSQHGWSVNDVTRVTEYQKKDIDLIITKENKQFTVEVKRDRYIGHTNNISLEFANSNNRKRKGEGWLNYTEADLLAVNCANSGDSYFFSVAELRDFCRNHKPHLYITFTKPGEFLMNIIVPLEKYIKTGNYFQKFKTKEEYAWTAEN